MMYQTYHVGLSNFAQILELFLEIFWILLIKVVNAISSYWPIIIYYNNIISHTCY